MSFEPAIPEWLRTARSVPSRTPSSFVPPFPGYTARFPKCSEGLVMATIGVQHAAASPANATKSLGKILSYISSQSVSDESRPGFHETASYTDNSGYHNAAVLAYWLSKDAYAAWAHKSGFQEWWNSIDPKDEEHGWFLELFFPSLDRWETVFSNGSVPEGAAHMRESLSCPILEHGYWGSMRDRLPASQTDELVGDEFQACREHSTLGQRIRVPGRQNLVVIRSGQDWSDTTPEERELYVNTMHPTLIKGMDFLRDHGDEVGCYNCRFMDIIDPHTGEAGKDRTFGLAMFDELSSLERWSKEHQTHVNIFAGFLGYARKLNNNISLRLFHEVLVLQKEQQLMEYINCHQLTGMLAVM
ncbi:heme-containing dehydratase protein [Xylariales sp. PMI_506]|nr:heme-containing dehydratase protein [Xylariales sp. PMI_506]